MPASHVSASEPPAGGLLPLADFSEVGELFARWQGRVEQISSGRFEGALHVVSGQHVRLVRVTGNQRLAFHGHDASRMFMVFPVTEGNGGSLWFGHRFSPGHLVYQHGDVEAEHLSARRTDNQGALLSAEALAEAARTLLTDAAALPNGWGAMAPPPGAFAALNRHYSLLLARGAADPSLVGTPEGHRLEQECVRAIVAALFPSAGRTPDLSLPARSRAFHRAEEYMRSHLGAPLGVIDLCRLLRTSDRNLRRAFRERTGLGPMAYFRCLRLNAVRARLSADPSVAIASVAHEFGFHHGGNFAADYRRLFGEKPSETARGAEADGWPPVDQRSEKVCDRQSP